MWIFSDDDSITDGAKEEKILSYQSLKLKAVFSLKIGSVKSQIEKKPIDKISDLEIP